MAEPDDSKSTLAKDLHSGEEYWLCECGVARLDADDMEEHLEEDGHMAERIDPSTGNVTGFMAAGLNNSKYGTQIPGAAQIKREANKNDPLFKR